MSVGQMIFPFGWRQFNTNQLFQSLVVELEENQLLSLKERYNYFWFVSLADQKSWVLLQMLGLLINIVC